MSTRSAFTIVGAVIGAYFGNPALGAAIGSYVGGVVDPVQVKGPRLTDAQQQTSQDGVPITVVFGVARVQGNIIASGPLVENKHKDNGKGSGTETTTYTYTRTYAIGICEGPIGGIRRIWKNGKLVYDATPMTPGDFSTDRILLAQFLDDHHLYLGTEDQTVDGELEAVLGAGKVPAFRGLAYMVGVDEDVTDIGGAIPTYEFEVVSVGATNTQYELVPASFGGVMPFGFDPEGRGDPRIVQGQYSYSAYGPGADLDTNSYSTLFEAVKRAAQLLGHDLYTSIPVSLGWGIGPSSFQQGWNSGTNGGNMYPWGTDGTKLDQSTLIATVMIPRAQFGSAQEAIAIGSGGVGWPCENFTGGRWASRYTGDAPPNPPGPTNSLYSGVVMYVGDEVDPPGHYDTTLICMPPEGGTMYMYGDYMVQVKARMGCNEFIDPDWVLVPGTSDVYVDRYGGYHSQSDCSVVSGAFKQLSIFKFNTGGTSYETLPVGPVLVTGDPLGTEEFWTDAYNLALAMGEVPPGWEYGIDYPKDATQACYCATGNVVDEGDITLAEIVARLCLRAGLSAEEIDVSELTDRVVGFYVSTQTNAADTINTLAPGFFFDGAEWDGITHFIKRGANHVEVLSIDDAIDSDGPRIEETRQQDVELPRKLILSYFDPAANFAVATQVASRVAETVNATGTNNLQIAVAMPSAQAAQVADVLLKDQWSALQGTIKQTVADRYSYLTPTDVIHLQDEGATFRLRLGQMTTEDGTLSYESTQDVQSAYTSRVEGVTPPTPDDGMDLPPSPTLAIVANLPALRDQDDQAGVYVFATGIVGTWRGAVIQISRDGGITWQSALTIQQAATIGQLTSELSNWNPDVPKYEASFTVRLTDGQLESITLPQLFQNMNGAVIGGEIIQFRSAVLTGPGEYLCTGLVRGRKNTVPVSHAVGENFCMLEDAYFLPLNRSDIGKTITLRAITSGTATTDAPVQSFVYDVPYSMWEWPVTNVRADRQTSGDIQMNWSPRARMGNAASPYQSIYFNGYQIVFTSVGVTKIYTSATNSFTYTQAMQIADFGSAPSTIQYSIAATNSLIGPGTSYSGTV